MPLTEYADHDGLGLADLLRCGETTPRELGSCVLAGIAAVNPRLNAFVTVTETLALEEAERADREIQAGKYRGRSEERRVGKECRL